MRVPPMLASFPAPRAVRIVVGFGLVAGWLLLALAASRLPLEYVLVAAFLPLIAVFVVQQAKYGAVFLLMTAALVRFSLPTGTQSRIVASLLLSALLVGLWLIRSLLIDKQLRLLPSPMNRPLVAIVAASVFSYVWGNTFRDPLVSPWRTWPIVQVAALAVMVLLPGVLFLAANTVPNVHWVDRLCWLTVGIGALVLVLKAVESDTRMINTGGLFSLWFVSLLYSQLLFNRRLPLLVKVVLSGLLLAWLYHRFVLNVRWLAGWIPPAFAIGVVTFIRSKRWFLVLMILLAMFFFLQWDKFAQEVVAGEAAESGVTRLAAWVANWRVTGRHFLFGTGPAGYAVYYVSYFPQEAMATHSNYIDILSQLGIVGLLLYLWFLGSAVAAAVRTWRRWRGRDGSGEALSVAILAGCVGVIIAMGLGDWLVPFVYTQTIAGFDHALYSWLWLGLMVPLAHDIEKGEMQRESLGGDCQLEHR